MIVETLPIDKEEAEGDNVISEKPFGGLERIPRGPLADFSEGEVEAGLNAQAFLEQIEIPRDPNAPVDVKHEKESVGKKLEAVAALIAKEKEKDGALGNVRAELGVAHETGETLKDLEKAREELKAHERNIELAEKYNDVLDSFGDSSKFSREDIQSIAETGKTQKGKSVHDRHGKELHSDLAKELGHMYQNGGRQVTWGDLAQLGKIVDKILHDVVSVVKGIFKGTGGGGERKTTAK